MFKLESPQKLVSGRELKKFSFPAPSTCPIDLFGLVANGTVLKRLHVVFDLTALAASKEHESNRLVAVHLTHHND